MSETSNSSSSSVPPETAPSTPSTAGKRLAVVVGVNNSPTSGLPDLKCPENDAAELQKVLEQSNCGFEVTAFSPKEADFSKIKRILRRLIRQAGDEDFLLFYFSGHGYPVKPKNKRSDVYLVTNDFEKEDIDDPDMYLSLNWLDEEVHQSTTAGIILIILDCCYSGNATAAGPDHYLINLREFFEQASHKYKQTDNGTRDRQRSILTSAGYNQTALEVEKDGHSLMTGLLLKALRGEESQVVDEKGQLPIERVYEYLKKRMKEEGYWPYLIGNLTRDCILAFDLEPGVNKVNQATDQATNRQERLKLLKSDHSGFVNNRLESFVGREQELVEIRERISEKLSTGGYVTITGQAGQGKSSVIARLVKEYDNANHSEAAAGEGEKSQSEDEAAKFNSLNSQIAHHFIPFNPGPDHQVGLLLNLMARLIEKHNLSDIFVASESRAALRDFFPRLLSQIAEKGEQEVIFVDGLDQLEQEVAGGRDLSFLPTDPPVGIVFVLGTRPDDTLKPLELLKPRQEYKLPNLSQADFNRILKHRKVQLPSDLIGRFYEAMQENALYLDLVARELQANPEIQPEEVIKRVADNPDNIFSLSMERFKKQRQEWRELLKPLLGILLVSQKPLSLRYIRLILGKGCDEEQVKDGLRQLGGLVAEDGEGRRYLFHLKLRDYLRQDSEKPGKEYVFADDEEEALHQRLAEWCERADIGLIWEDTEDKIEQGRRLYARHYYVIHLYRAADWPKLWAVLDEGSYGKAKLRYDPATRLYAQDLDLGRDSVLNTKVNFSQRVALLPRLWRYTLLRCSLASQADNYPEEAFGLMVQLGREQEALGLVELLTNPQKKISVMARIVAIFYKQPERQLDGKLLLARAYELGGRASEWDRAALLEPLVKVSDLADPELLERALSIARSIKFKESSSRALSSIAGSLGKSQEWELALETARSIQDPSSRGEALSSIAGSLLQAGKSEAAVAILSEALEMARSIQSPSSRDEALSSIAESLLQAEKIEQAVSLVLEAWNTYSISNSESIKVLEQAVEKFAEREANQPLLRLVHSSWRQATTREFALKVLPLVGHFFKLKPEIAQELLRSFSEVDQFLQQS